MIFCFKPVVYITTYKKFLFFKIKNSLKFPCCKCFLCRIRKKYFFDVNEYKKSIDLVKFQYYNPGSDFSLNDSIKKEFDKNG